MVKALITEEPYLRCTENDGFGNRRIAREIRSFPGFVQKVIDRYNEQNISLRGIRVGVPIPYLSTPRVQKSGDVEIFAL